MTVLNPQQFMRPGRVKALVKWSPDLTSGQSMRSLWAEKEQESRESGLYDSVAEHGVREPVVVHVDYSAQPPMHTMGPGHHRVAAAHAVERDTGKKIKIPVRFD